MKNKSTNRPIKDPIYTPIKVAINWKWHNRKAKKTKSEISYKRCNSNFYNGRKKLHKNFGNKKKKMEIKQIMPKQKAKNCRQTTGRTNKHKHTHWRTYVQHPNMQKVIQKIVKYLEKFQNNWRAPGNTLSGWSTWVERSGGGSGGSCPNGSWSFEMEDVGGEIIERSPMVAMSLFWPAISVVCSLRGK